MSTVRSESRLWALLQQGGAVLPVEQPTNSLLPVWQPSPETPLQDYAFWADDFGKWALECCRFRDRCFGGIKVLHANFSDWCIAQQTVGCMLETFEALLEAESFLLASGLVSGLVLKEDLQEHSHTSTRAQGKAAAR